MPFGEEIFTGGWRTSFSGYGVADGLRQKFTAQERDSETGLDYMKARYFSSVAGRFTTPDPALSSGRAAIPQSWNRYAYTLGNPLKYIDPTGLFEWDASLRDDPKLSAGEREKRRKLREAFLKALQDAKEQAKKLTGEKQKKLNDALNAYGEKDTANGVTVGVGTDKGHVGDTLPTFYINDKWNGVTPNIEVKFDPKVLLSDDAMVAVAHEGAHVEDAFTFANSYDALTDLKPEDRLKDPRDATQYDTENHAFHVQSYLFEAMGKNDGKWGTWQKSWAELDKKEPNGEEKARQGAVTKTIKDYYGWTEQNKGWNMGSRACKQPNC
jgi:RHS repeat-associated protein